MNSHAAQQSIDRVVAEIERMGCKAHLSQGRFRTVIGAVGEEGVIDQNHLASLDGVEKVVPIMKPYKLASREFHEEDSVVEVGGGKTPAVKVGGRRLHELAREGIEVERAARRVTVWRFDTAPDLARPGIYRAEIVCSSGTYIRVLADDLGRALGGGAHVADLRRTRIGSFGAEDMHHLDAIGPDQVLTPAQALRDLDAVTVDADAAASIRTGLPLDRIPLGAIGDGPWAMLDAAGELLAVYEATGSDRIRPAVVLAGQ